MAGWDRVRFFPGSWYWAVFWIQYRNNDDNTLMCWLLLNGDYHISRTLVTCQWEKAQEAGKEPGRDSWPKKAKFILHTTEFHAHLINWGQWARRHWSLLDMMGHQLTGDELYCASFNLLVLYFPFPCKYY